MTDNPHQQTIILHGGPHDGELRQVSDSVVRYGRLIVALAPDLSAFRERDSLSLLEPVRRGSYRRQHMADGRYGTCECRDWYEWHWMGEE